MFQIAKKTQGPGGSFVKLAQLDSDDFVVVVRRPREVRLTHRYVGPDFYKAEEMFDQEGARLLKEEVGPEQRAPLRPDRGHR
jgi:hypothetical protein